MFRLWYMAIDQFDSDVRAVMLDFSKVFGLINHHLLLENQQIYGLLYDRWQRF